RYQRPECLGDFQPLQNPFVVDGAADELETHGVDLAGRRFDLLLDFIQCERVVAALIPVALAVNGVEIEAAGFGGFQPVVAFGAGDALHRLLLAAAMRMAVATAMEVMQRAAEAAISG